MDVIISPLLFWNYSVISDVTLAACNLSCIFYAVCLFRGAKLTDRQCIVLTNNLALFWWALLSLSAMKTSYLKAFEFLLVKSRLFKNLLRKPPLQTLLGKTITPMPDFQVLQFNYNDNQGFSKQLEPDFNWTASQLVFPLIWLSHSWIVFDYHKTKPMR